MDSAQRVGFFNIGSGRVLDKIPGCGSGSGRVGVLKYSIVYFRVSYLLSGISGYLGYFRVLPGIFVHFLYFSCPGQCNALQGINVLDIVTCCVKIINRALS